MNKLVRNCISIAVLFALSVTLLAQVEPDRNTRFIITLAEGRRDGTMVWYQQILEVTLTNTSDKTFHRSSCEFGGGMINLEVVYNGVRIPETEAERKNREHKESGMCLGSMIVEHTKPGEKRKDVLYYDTLQPGTYEFTATKKTDPAHPEKSVTVRSNTITIVVPEHEESAPQ